MNPEEFIDKWRGAELKESAAYQEHFTDLCRLLEVPTPAEIDKKGVDYAFQKHVGKNAGGKGFADVWKKNCFIWEYKGDARNLVRAYGQAKEYSDFLGNPPLIIVSDMKEIRVHTASNNSVAKTIPIPLSELGDIKVRRQLRKIFDHKEVEAWRPTITPAEVTAEAAGALAIMANKLRRRYEPKRVAHFLNKLVFCMFAEDIDLLPDDVFSAMVEDAGDRPHDFTAWTADLFTAMRKDHGRFDRRSIPWFNGGLFDDDDVLAIGGMDIKDLAVAAQLDWRNIEPSIFGTLFEKGLDPERRAEMAGLFDGKIPERVELKSFEKGATDKGVGIHYTDPATIMKIVEPVVLRPLRAEWEEVKKKIKGLKRKSDKDAAYLAFRERLGKFRVLDPACGSGNFLYLALLHLKDFDLKVTEDAAKLGLARDKVDQRITPDNVLGIEINPYAAELARVTVWIGDLQWQYRNKLLIVRKPLLSKLDGIVCKDALINDKGIEVKWPAADAIIGNPPFLGDKMMIGQLGEEYVARLRNAFDGQIPGGADLVCYWFGKAGKEIEKGYTRSVGLVSTNGIRFGKNRQVVDALLAKGGELFEAWSDLPWTIDGADVRVSLLCFDSHGAKRRNGSKLNGKEVEKIFSDLTPGFAGSADLTHVLKLNENDGVSYFGYMLAGAFGIEGDEARRILRIRGNPHRKPNSDVVKPLWNGIDVTRRNQDRWVIDFGPTMSASDAALYEAPFQILKERVQPVRMANREPSRREYWWRFGRARPELRKSAKGLTRMLVTPETMKNRSFRWMPITVDPEHSLIVFVRDDDAFFGILESRFHRAWVERLGNRLGVGNDLRYNSTRTFETFPFPHSLTPDIPAENYKKDRRTARIAAAAKRLNELRENWLNPSDLVKYEAEVVHGYPDRIIPVDSSAVIELKKRTLTKLYNEPPEWLINAHKELDAAVAAAYGWPEDISDEEALRKLFELNQERAKKQGNAEDKNRKPSISRTPKRSVQ